MALQQNCHMAAIWQFAKGCHKLNSAARKSAPEGRENFWISFP